MIVSRCQRTSAGKGRVTVEFFETALNVAGGKRAVASVLKSEQPFTAILCFSDVLALGTYFALSEAGIGIPSEMSVMGFDNLDWSEHVVPALTTIDLPAWQMGCKVASQLVDYLKRATPIRPIQLSGKIIERQSVGRIPPNK